MSLDVVLEDQSTVGEKVDSEAVVPTHLIQLP